MTERGHQASLFDGRSAAALPVRAAAAGGRLQVFTGEGEPLHDLPLAELELSEPFAAAPRMVGLPGGATLEVHEAAAFGASIGAAGRPAGLVARLQQSWPATTAALVLLVVALVAGYRIGLPAASRALARALPASAERRLGEAVLATLDAGLLQPSGLSEARRGELGRAFARLGGGAPEVTVRLVHRRAEAPFGLNAFALPGGTVVLLDGIPEAVAGDEVVAAVLAHELCHQAERDPTRAILQAAGVTAAASLVWGDISGQASSAPALLLAFRYSRELEAAADACALRRLRATGLPPRALLGALALLEAAARGAGFDRVPGILSTHPPVAERMAALQGEPDVGGLRLGSVQPGRATSPVAVRRVTTAEAPFLDLQNQVNALGDQIARERDPTRKARLQEEFRERREQALAAKEAFEATTPSSISPVFREEDVLREAAALGAERGLTAVFVGAPRGVDAEDLTDEVSRRLARAGSEGGAGSPP